MGTTTPDPILCLLVSHSNKQDVLGIFNLHLTIINDVDCFVTSLSYGDGCLFRSFAYFLNWYFLTVELFLLFIYFRYYPLNRYTAYTYVFCAMADSSFC